ncbi:integrase catalytic domain-containing protein [Trichonephila clavipes]|uniref:Integrase catalytic domain-containing protein n=1 Tax=Trichonephila clavipes TaxID=2585209 RepID=A0A8X6R678_TRICX|nr:integrase catalytic domain-containing protein [Trichonephila clavipes]
MTLHSPTENNLAVLNHKILEANSQVQNVKLGGHPTCLSINRLWHELCDMLRRLVGTTAPGHHDCSIQEFKKCWKIEDSWDSKLPIEIERKFETRKKHLIEVQDLKIPRRLSNLDLKDTNLSLQVFCDALKLSDTTCVFLQAGREGEVTCQLIQARSKFTPLKGISLTRLELLASMIGGRIADSIKKDLHMENVDVTYWSNSIDAHSWINRESSGCSVKILKNVRWWEGPSWLRNPTEDWSKSELFPDMEVINSEKKTIITAAATQREENYHLRYLSYVKLLRITT